MRISLVSDSGNGLFGEVMVASKWKFKGERFSPSTTIIASLHGGCVAIMWQFCEVDRERPELISLWIKCTLSTH